MSAEIATALITVGGAAILAVITYGLTKKREREAVLRAERLAHYKDFVASLSGIVTSEDTPDGQRAFAKACNNLNLVAPQSVIQALQAFQEEIRVSNPSHSRERHDQLLSKLLYAIRLDLCVAQGQSRLQGWHLGIWCAHRWALTTRPSGLLRRRLTQALDVTGRSRPTFTSKVIPPNVTSTHTQN